MWAKERKKDLEIARKWYGNLLTINAPYKIVDDDFLYVVSMAKKVGVTIEIPRDKTHIPEFDSLLARVESIGKDIVKEIEDFNVYDKPSKTQTQPKQQVLDKI